jgi:hypothetical protein
MKHHKGAPHARIPWKIKNVIWCYIRSIRKQVDNQNNGNQLICLIQQEAYDRRHMK